MTTSPQLTKALKAISDDGHIVGEASVDADGSLRVRIDGEWWTCDAIYIKADELGADLIGSYRLRD